MPNSEGEKLHEPIIWRERLPEGTDPAQLGGCRCRHRSGTGGSVPTWGGPARLSEPLTGSTGQSAAAEQLAACLHVRVRAQCARSPGPRRADPARLPHLRVPALPSAGEKAFCATWDEEQGSGGREDDPAGRMVHLGAAVGERLLCSLLAAAAVAAAAAFGLR